MTVLVTIFHSYYSYEILMKAECSKLLEGFGQFPFMAEKWQAGWGR